MPTLTADTPSVHPTYLRLLCLALRRHDLDADALLAPLGMGDFNALLHREALVPQALVSALVIQADRLAGEGVLALEVGASFRATAHGPLGHAIVASANLTQALSAVERFASIRNAALRFALRPGSDGAKMEVTEVVDHGAARTTILTIIAATILHMAETVSGDRLPKLQVDFPFAKPAWHARLEAGLGVQARFGMPRLVIHTPQDLLALPCGTADALTYGDALRACEREMALRESATMTERVRERLRAVEDAWPDLGTLAGLFAMSERTLIRRLKVEGTSYQALVDERRRERAQWYLNETGVTIEAIAARLGYTDTSNFSRAYRRWFGVAPSLARRRP